MGRPDLPKLDRLTRSLLDFERLVKWLQDRGKTLSASIPRSTSLRQPVGRSPRSSSCSLSSSVRLYGSGPRSRTTSSSSPEVPGRPARLRLHGTEAPKNWGSCPTRTMLRSLPRWRRLRQVRVLRQIAMWLNGSGVPTGPDAMRKRKGQPMRGTKWKLPLSVSCCRDRASSELRPSEMALSPSGMTRARSSIRPIRS